MSVLQIIIIVVLAIVALCALFEARRRRGEVSRNKPEFLRSEETSKTALEMEPTHTARIRVKDMLAKTDHLKDGKNKTKNTEDEEESLPDPFSDKD